MNSTGKICPNELQDNEDDQNSNSKMQKYDEEMALSVKRSLQHEDLHLNPSIPFQYKQMQLYNVIQGGVGSWRPEDPQGFLVNQTS